MGMVRFRLDGIAAFRNRDGNGDGKHFCVNCAREAAKGDALIPFLDGQLHAMLSEFGKDLGAMLSCDECGGVMGTYYPERFWTGNKEQDVEQLGNLIFRKF